MYAFADVDPGFVSGLAGMSRIGAVPVLPDCSSHTMKRTSIGPRALMILPASVLSQVSPVVTLPTMHPVAPPCMSLHRFGEIMEKRRGDARSVANCV